MECYEKSLKFFEEIRDKLGITQCSNNFSIMMVKMDRIKEGKELAERSLKLARNLVILIISGMQVIG